VWRQQVVELQLTQRRRARLVRRSDEGCDWRDGSDGGGFTGSHGDWRDGGGWRTCGEHNDDGREWCDGSDGDGCNGDWRDGSLWCKCD
jgi:hypothetical protein